MSALEEPADDAAFEEDDILVVRRGPGANCSSIGSALDILFVTATVAGVALAVTAATLSAMKGKVGPPSNGEPAPAPDDLGHAEASSGAREG